MKRSKKIFILISSFFLPILIVGGVVGYLEIINHGKFFNNGENFLLADMASQYNSLYKCRTRFR